MARVKCAAENTRASEFPGEKICLAFLGQGAVDVSQKISEKGDCGLFSHFSGACIMHLVLSSSECFPETLTILILPQA